jgi:hypothetical protein
MTLSELADEVGRSAAACPPAAELAAAVRRSPEPVTLAVVVAAAAAGSGCLPWLREQFPDDVRVVSADSDFTAAALVADAVVLLFPWWGVPDPTLVTRWQAVLNVRPEGTVRVVLDEAELMTMVDDRRAADTLVRRWLLPTADGSSPAFLWSNDPGRPDDRHRLRDAVTRPLSSEQRQALNVARLSHAIRLLEEAKPAAVPPAPLFPADDDRERAAALTHVRRIRDDATTAVRLAFDDLEHRFERRLPQLEAVEDRPGLETAVADLIDDWRHGPAAGAVNQLLASDRWTAEVPSPVEAAVRQFTRPDLDAPPLAPRPTGGYLPYLRTAGAAVVTPLLAVGLGVPVVGVIGGTVVATASVLMYDRLNDQRSRRSAGHQRLRGHVLGRIARVRAEVDGELAAAMAAALERCKAALAAARPPARPPAPPTPFAGWREVLAALS